VRFAPPAWCDSLQSAPGNVDNGLHGATITAVPEPSTHLVVAAAAAGMWLMARRRTSSKIHT
jgi:hypothetical protein